VRRARGGAARVVVVWARVVRSAVARGCGTHAALLLVSFSSGGKWRGRRSATCAARTRRCCSCRCRRGASGVVLGRPRVRRARGGAARVVVVWARVVRSSVGRWCGAHTAQALVSFTFGGKWRGRRSAAGAACTRRCCSCRCRLGASRVVFGRPLVRRAHGATACVVDFGGQVAWSLLGRGCGAQAALLHVSLSLRRKWGGWCGRRSSGLERPDAAVASSWTRESCGRRSAAGAARTRRNYLCRCRRGASGVVVGRPRVRRAGGGAARVVVAWAQVGGSVRQAVKWLGETGRGSGVVVDARVMRSAVRRGCGAHAALLLVSLSSGGKGRCLRSAAGAARRRRCCSCRGRLGACRVVFGRPRVRRAHGPTASVVELGGKWRGRRSAAGAARTRRCCSCRCRRGASGVVFGRPRVRRAGGGVSFVVVVGGQVVWSSVGRGCGVHAAVLLVSLSLGRKWRGRRSAAGAARTRRCC